LLPQHYRKENHHEKNTSKIKRKYSHLILAEREEIAMSLEIGLKQCEIAL
jgi:hypothetical protein